MAPKPPSVVGPGSRCRLHWLQASAGRAAACIPERFRANGRTAATPCDSRSTWKRTRCLLQAARSFLRKWRPPTVRGGHQGTVGLALISTPWPERADLAGSASVLLSPRPIQPEADVLCRLARQEQPFVRKRAATNLKPISGANLHGGAQQPCPKQPAAVALVVRMQPWLRSTPNTLRRQFSLQGGR